MITTIQKTESLTIETPDSKTKLYVFVNSFGELQAERVMP